MDILAAHATSQVGGEACLFHHKLKLGFADAGTDRSSAAGSHRVSGRGVGGQRCRRERRSDGVPQRRRPLHPAAGATGVGARGWRGRIIVLSHPRDSAVLYDFDSWSALSIRQHRFAPAAIARPPREGNYRGGAGNGNDVLLWRSRPNAAGGFAGKTMLLQRPAGDTVEGNGEDAVGWAARVLESVAWTTTMTTPALSWVANRPLFQTKFYFRKDCHNFEFQIIKR